MATHAENTRNQWRRLRELVAAVDRWEAFFRPLVGRPETATALVKLGMKAVRGDLLFGPEARRKVEEVLKKHG